MCSSFDKPGLKGWLGLCLCDVSSIVKLISKMRGNQLEILWYDKAHAATAAWAVVRLGRPVESSLSWRQRPLERRYSFVSLASEVVANSGFSYTFELFILTTADDRFNLAWAIAWFEVINEFVSGRFDEGII